MYNQNNNIHSIFRCQDVGINSDTDPNFIFNCLNDDIKCDPDGGADELPAHPNMDQKNDCEDNLFNYNCLNIINNDDVVEVVEDEVGDELKENNIITDTDDDSISNIGYLSDEQDYVTDEFLIEREKGLLIVQWNCQGLTVNACAHIHYIIDTKRPDLFLVQEGYVLYDEKHRNWIEHINGYITWTINSGFGKVFILAREGIYAERINIRFNHNIVMDKLLDELDKNDINYKSKRNDILMSKLYVLTLKINSLNIEQSVIVNNWYRPQHGSKSTAKLFTNYLDKLINTKNFGKYPIYSGGDGNIHNNLWYDGDIRNSEAAKQGEVFADWIYERKWTVLNNGRATRIGKLGEKVVETAPDIASVNNYVDEEDWKFWVEDFTRYNDGKHYSDHLVLYSFYMNCDLYEEGPDLYAIRTGDECDWDNYRSAVADNFENWWNIYGDKFDKLIELYLKWYGDGNSDIDASKLMDKIGTSNEEIEEGIEKFFMEVIVDTGKHSLGLKKIGKKKNKPWMTNKIRNSIDDYKYYLKEFQSFSKRKKKICKERLNSLREKKNQLCNNGQTEWIKMKCRNSCIDGRIPWKKIKEVVKYDSNNQSVLPVWYNEDGSLHAVKSIDKANNFLHYIHRFDDDEIANEVDTLEKNDKFEKLIENYHMSNNNKFGKKLHRDELKILNGIMKKKEVVVLINSFSKRTCGNSDEATYTLFQRAVDILRDGFYTCYNMMFIMSIRPQFMNLRDVALVLKGGKKDKYMGSYRPVSLLSCCSNPFDKWMACKYLRYGIKMKIIRIRHFGFIKGLGCIDAILYIVQLIWNNKVIGMETHMVFLDFKAAFDTVQHIMLLEVMEVRIGINGFALRYLYVCLEYRWGRVKVFVFYSEYRQDVCGVPQGWPPSPICFIFITIEFDVINDLKLGLFIIGYADDNTLVSDGTVNGDELQQNLQFALDLIGYIAKRKRLWMQTVKQNYMVISDIADDDHKQLYFDLKLDEDLINHIYTFVKYLGIALDWKLDWNVQYRNMIYNGRSIYTLISNKYKHAKNILASHLIMIYNAYVMPKFLYAAEIWYNKSHPLAGKLKTLFNDIMRDCTKSLRTAPTKWLYVQLGEVDLDNRINYRKATLWSRVIRTPESNVLNNIIGDTYWDYWLYDRDNEDMNDEYIPVQNIDVKIPFDMSKIDIKNKLKKANLDDNWIMKVQNDDSCNPSLYDLNLMKYRKKVKGRYHLMYELYDSAKDLNSSDWVCMKGIDFKIVPKRISYHLDRLDIPINLFYYSADNEEEKLSFTKEWVNDWCDSLYYYDDDEGININKVEQKHIQLVFSDGSNKEQYGGAGFWSTNLEYYLKTNDLKYLRDNNYVICNNDSINGISHMCYGSMFTGLRSSIDHCELDAAIEGLSSIYSYCYNIYNTNNSMELVPKHVCLIIDNEVVVKWIAGVYITEDILICNKLKKVYEMIEDLKDFEIDVHLIWVKSHNNEEGNESADDMAKAGMFSGYVSKNWKDVEKVYGENEWIHYGYNALKKEHKRKGWWKTIKSWNDEKYEKIKKGDACLSKYLLEWNIGHSVAYKFERKNLSLDQWEIICGFRHGHINLNGQKKYGMGSIYCDNDSCGNKIEDIMHFIFDCDNYSNERIQLLNNIEFIYQLDEDEEEDQICFSNLSDIEKLKFILFPFMDELKEDDVKNDKVKIKRIVDKRIVILKEFCSFVMNTNRFATN
eukprot:340340_1